MIEDIMVDLETLDTKPGAIILSIGACVFDDTGIGKTFYSAINLESSISHGLTESESTRKWWNAQCLINPSAAKVLGDAVSETKSLHDVLTEFNSFIGSENRKVKIWGNGSDFDNVILLEAYRRAGIEPAWGPFGNRCYRTLKSMLTGIAIIRSGTHHNALDDAVNQANHMIQTLHAYGMKVNTIT